MERILLLGGPFSGQFHDVAVGAPDFQANHASGDRYVYVRTELVDQSDDYRIVIFRHTNRAAG